MANPFAIASALARTVSITCPHCGSKKLVARKPAHHRVCVRCRRQFPDPLSSKPKPKPKR
jgi:DNA-directed RNA polymerase subunit RPC12/RpoP